MSNDKKQYNVCDGIMFSDHEDYLVGDKEGLMKMKEAIDIAINNGEAEFVTDEYEGIRCVDTSLFEQEQTETIFEKAKGWLYMGFLYLMIVAAGTKFYEWIKALI
ncbi:hypothetical protein SAMN02745866_03193 [Alteromonadaceae bacterium Bs31]|nr:hypothetical protein SAMN02745866_03193 [Alteromonadaceae bacterium Bs31]